MTITTKAFFTLTLFFDIQTIHSNIALLPEFYWEEEECATPSSYTLESKPDMWNDPYRAYKTLPDGMRIDPSSIEGTGLGVFSDIFIPRHTFLAEFEGEIVLKLDHISDYAWKVKRNGKKYFYVDAYDVATSNWLRWLNCSRHAREENVEVLECRGRMYCVTNKDVYPGQELLIYYGDGYAESLGIDVDRYSEDSYYEEAMKLNGLLDEEE